MSAPLTDPGRSHERRDRAESFGADAEAYDRFRPGYPDGLLDDVLPSRGLVIDLGCGTGQLAAAVAARGHDVVGVEVDDRMAAVARAKGLTVHTGSFEDWDGPRTATGQPRPAEVIVCGQAWHWIDPLAGPRKAVSLLRSGGLLVLAWNWSKPTPAMTAALDRAYRAAPSLGPGSIVRGGGPATVPTTMDSLRDTELFDSVSLQHYSRTLHYSPESWVELIGTHSDHRALPPGELRALSNAVRVELSALGEDIAVPYETDVILARAASGGDATR